MRMTAFTKSRRRTTSEKVPLLSEGEHAQNMNQELPFGITPQTADEMLAQTMNQLSVEERNQVFEDVHGVARNDPFVGDKDREGDFDSYFVNQCLSEMHDDIMRRVDSIVNNGGRREQVNEGEGSSYPAYVQAIQRDKDYVMNSTIMFLRAEMYQVKHAVTRLISYFACKLELFGPELLVKDISLSDLNQDDMHYLECGYHQVLPGTDRGGRSLIFFHRGNTPQEQQHFDDIPWMPKLRVVWFMVMNLLLQAKGGDTIQESGYVCVAYDCTNAASFTKNTQVYAWKICKLICVLPFKMMCLHYCYNDRFKDTLMSILRTALGPYSRARLRAHYSKTSYLEIMYQLMTFGITPDILPIQQKSCNATMPSETTQEMEGFVTLHLHKLYCERLRMQRLQQRQQQQQQQDDKSVHPTAKKTPTSSSAEGTKSSASSSPVIVQTIEPTEKDVLLGRGRPVKHLGNIKLHKLIDQYQEQYENEDKFGKTVIAELVVRTITEEKDPTDTTSDDSGGIGGGRFLRQDMKTGNWNIVSDSVARDRVAHGFRNKRSRRNEQQNYSSSRNDAAAVYSPSMITMAHNHSNDCMGIDCNPCGGSGVLFMNSSKRLKVHHPL